jgi:hypothetical protein
MKFRYYIVTSLVKPPVVLFQTENPTDLQAKARSIIELIIGVPVESELIVACWDGDEKEWNEVRKLGKTKIYLV